jgi:hypothetical protein
MSDVVFIPGTNIGLTQSGQNITITATGITWADLIRFEIPTPSPDGTEATFTVTNSYQANSLLVYRDGIQQILGSGRDYIATGGTTFVMTTIPNSGEVVWVSYIKTS